MEESVPGRNIIYYIGKIVQLPRTCHGKVAGSVAALISQGPDDHTGVVLIPHAHPHPPINDAIQPVLPWYCRMSEIARG